MPVSTVDAMANEFSLEAQISTVESSAQLPKLDSHSAAQSQRNTNVPGTNVEAYRVALPSVVPVCAPATADNIPRAAMPVSTVDAMANEFSLEAQISTVESAQLPCTAMPDYDSANNTDSDYVPGY